MAIKKSTNIYWLYTHIIVYGLSLFIIILGGLLLVELSFPNNFGRFVFIITINTLSHGVVDYLTSRISKKYFEKSQMKAFYNMLGLDQLIHLIILITTFTYLN